MRPREAASSHRRWTDMDYATFLENHDEANNPRRTILTLRNITQGFEYQPIFQNYPSDVKEHDFLAGKSGFSL
jgi:hypothetical protein